MADITAISSNMPDSLSSDKPPNSDQDKMNTAFSDLLEGKNKGAGDTGKPGAGASGEAEAVPPSNNSTVPDLKREMQGLRNELVTLRDDIRGGKVKPEDAQEALGKLKGKMIDLRGRMNDADKAGTKASRKTLNNFIDQIDKISSKLDTQEANKTLNQAETALNQIDQNIEGRFGDSVVSEATDNMNNILDSLEQLDLDSLSPEQLKRLDNLMDHAKNTSDDIGYRQYTAGQKYPTMEARLDAFAAKVDAALAASGG